MGEELTFQAGEWWNGARDVAEFAALVGRRKIQCGISLEALCDDFGGDNKEPLNAFRANRAEIEAIAARLIKQQRFEKDGSILIRSGVR